MRIQLRTFRAALFLLLLAAQAANGQVAGPLDRTVDRFEAARLAPTEAVLHPSATTPASWTASWTAASRGSTDQVWDDSPRIGNLVSFGVVGALVGGVVVAAITDCLTTPLDPRCWPINVGQAIGVATGVHFGNARRGIFAVDLLASGLVAAGGLAALQDEARIGVTSAPAAVILLPLGELLVTVVAERLTDR